jgi:regulator of RNase E activity RraA
VTGHEGHGRPAGKQTDPLLARLSALDACLVSDALDWLGMTGSVLGLGPLWPGARLAGRARTVLTGPPPGGHVAAATVATAGPGDVVVIAGGGRLDVSCWGGILTAAATARGAAGVVIDGAARDVDEVRLLGFPAFALGAVTRTARGRIAQAGADEPVDVAGVHVTPGDLVIADGSGVVFVPANHGDAVLGIAERLQGREARLLERLRAGEPVTELMSDASLTQGAGGAGGAAGAGGGPGG